MADLIYDTTSTLKIDPPEVIIQGEWKFHRTYVEMVGYVPKMFTWDSEVITDPTRQDLIEQAQQHLDDIGDNHHVFLEGFKIQKKRRRIKIQLGS